MSKIFKSGKIVVDKVNESGNIIETLCVEIERDTRKPQDENCKKVLYPLLTCNGKYIFENIDIAVMSGLKKEDILQEIKKYLVDKSNYKEQEKIKENKKDFSNADLWETIIENVTTLEELSQVYYVLSVRKIINRYKDKIFRKLNEVDVSDPFFFADFSKYSDFWTEENNEYCFIRYMYKIELLLEKYKNLKYDQVIDFNLSLIKKGDYLEELLCNFINHWRDYGISYFISDEENLIFFSLYSKFEYAQFNSYVVSVLFAIYENSCFYEKDYIPKNIKTMLFEIQEKVDNKLKEIHFPVISFEYNYMRALENNSYIDFAKANFQANTKENKDYMTVLEDKIKSEDFDIEEALLLILCLFRNHKSKFEWDINIKALTTILDNYELKKNSHFKRIHFWFYESVYYYLNENDIKTEDLLEIKKLYDNNCSKYTEQMKMEFDSIYKWCR